MKEFDLGNGAVTVGGGGAEGDGGRCQGRCPCCGAGEGDGGQVVGRGHADVDRR